MRGREHPLVELAALAAAGGQEVGGRNVEVGDARRRAPVAVLHDEDLSAVGQRSCQRRQAVVEQVRTSACADEGAEHGGDATGRIAPLATLPPRRAERLPRPGSVSR